MKRTKLAYLWFAETYNTNIILWQLTTATLALCFKAWQACRDFIQLLSYDWTIAIRRRDIGSVAAVISPWGFTTFSSWFCISQSQILISFGILFFKVQSLLSCCVVVCPTSHPLSGRAGVPCIILPSRSSKSAPGIQPTSHRAASMGTGADVDAQYILHHQHLNQSKINSAVFPPCHNCNHASIVEQSWNTTHAVLHTHMLYNPLRAGINLSRDSASAAPCEKRRVCSQSPNHIVR